MDIAKEALRQPYRGLGGKHNLSTPYCTFGAKQALMVATAEEIKKRKSIYA